MGTTASIYARLSDDKRKGTTDEGKSVDEQIDECKAFIARKGWTVGTVYRDDSISATSGALRPEFERMLKEAPPIVVAYRSSRLSRDVMDTLKIKAAGITGYLEDGGMLDFSSGDATMLTLIRSVVDAADGQKKAEFQKLRNLSDAKAGKWHYARPVFGNDRITGALIPDEAEAIRKAAEALATGETTFFQTAKEWNAAGFRTPKSKGAGGRLWEPGTVRNFFTAPRLIGERVYNGVAYQMKGWEPLLDRETFDAIQQMIEANKTGKRGVQGSRSMPHLLTSIATCSVCGKGLNVSYRGGKGSTRNYRCTTPGHVSRVAEPLEKWVVEKFLYLLLHEGADRVVHPEGAETAHKLRMERATLVRAFDAWMEEAVEADVSPKAMKAKEDAHARKLAEIDARLLEALRETSFAMLVSDIPRIPELMWERWESVPMDKKRSVIQSLFASIEVLPGAQGARFKPKFVKLKATPLMMQLVELNVGGEVKVMTYT